MMLYIISYDIPDNKRRLKISEILLDFGRRVQYSVFEAYLDHCSLTTLKKRLRQVISDEDDSIRIYRLCGDCERHIEILGQGESSKPPSVYIL